MTEQTLERPSVADLDTTPVQLNTSGVSELNESAESKAVSWGSSSDGEDVDYVPVSPWAPIALSMGLLGLTGFIGYFGLYVAFFGIFVGIGAINQIRSAGGFVKGTWMATAGRCV